MSHPHEQLARYVDGELDDAEAEALQHHLVVCAECSDVLHDALQLAALEAAVRGAISPVRDAAARDTEAAAGRAAPPVRAGRAVPDGEAAPVIPIGTRPRSGRARTWRRALAIALPAAAVIALALAIPRIVRPPPVVPEAPVVLASAAVRAIEGRISYAAADRYRPYDVARGGSAAPAPDAIPLDTIARLERRSDLHGVAAAFLLTGDAASAATYLERAAPGPDVTADRALLQLAAGRAAEALTLLDGVLAAVPRHPQALWNRALALRDLGLTRSAAEAFEAVAALGEAGWSDEARRRARALAAELDARKAAFLALATADGPRLAAAPDAVAPELARRFPGMARLMFYDAVRGARSADAVRALAPLARTLDTVYGDEVLAGYVEHVARADFAVRGPLAARYAALGAGVPLDSAAARDLVSALRAAHADDLRFGALVRIATRDPAAAAAVLPELRRLGDAAGDPWLHLIAVEREAAVWIARGDHAAAEAVARPALASCEASRLDYRCTSLALVLGGSYRTTLRLTDARRVLGAGLARARRGGEWYLEQSSLELLAEVEMLGDDVAGSTLPLVRAYTRELVLRDPDRCDLGVWGSAAALGCTGLPRP